MLGEVATVPAVRKDISEMQDHVTAAVDVDLVRRPNEEAREAGSAELGRQTVYEGRGPGVGRVAPTSRRPER